uniref:Ig-like domain-containing protein n=1 Tax=Salarias fasciatus TaxID=181472 RepID=A0A672IQA8_SALFA
MKFRELEVEFRAGGGVQRAGGGSSSRSCWPLCTVGVSVSCLIRLLCGVSSMWPLLVFPGSESGSGSGSSDRSSVLVGSPVSLPCVFERRTEPLDRGALTVEWNVVDRRGDKSIVYTFEDGGARPSRGDCAVDARRLLLGDASLLLHNVTVADEGLYTCRVITPLVHSQTAALEVLARPSVSLPERCAVSAYYPEKLAVTWHVANGSHTLGAGLGRSARVCTELATRNPDGTFSIRSGVTLHSSAVAAYSAGSLVAVSSVLGLLLASALMGGVFLLYRHFGRGEFSSRWEQASQCHYQKSIFNSQ